ncbi:MAG: alpha/beta fold hydrolase [Pseudomonadota bacterium]
MAEVRGLAALLMTAFLSACAAGGPLPDGKVSTLPDREPREGPTLPGTPGADSVMRASDGTEVAGSEWVLDAPKVVVLALHGFGDYGQLTFRGPATFWAEQGIATIAPDQRGFGRNPSRGRWAGADGMIADAAGFMAQVRERFPCTRLILLGHSMGGGIAMAAAAEASPDALVLAAPAIWGGRALNPLHRLAAWTAAVTVPERRFTGRGVVRIIPSDNQDALRAIWADPLYLAPPSAREIFGLVRVTDRAAGAAASVDTPALMLLGEKDQIVPNTRVLDVFALTEGPQRVISYPEGWHLLFRDMQARQVWQDVADFVLAAEKPKGCS